MKINELKERSKNYPIFKLEDVFKWFPKAKRETTLNQLNVWVKKGYLENITRGIYKISDFELKDSFLLSNFIYSPSYISLESALNYYGIIPDIPFGITSVTLNKTKTFKTQKYGVFYYHHIKPELFFGFQTIFIEKNYSFNIALPEKAIFDYFYLKAKKVESPEGFIEEMRLSLPKKFNWRKLKNWTNLVSKKNKTFFQLMETLFKKYVSK
jgi:predicted transcriptional regulator of viral defense system